MAQESRHRAVGYSGLTRGEPAFSSLKQSLAGCSFLQAVRLRTSVPHWLLSGDCPQGISQHGSLCLPEQSRRPERARARQNSGFYNLTLEEISYYICCSLFFRSRSLGPAYAWVGRDYTRAASTQPYQGSGQ